MAYNRDTAGAAALAFARQWTGHPYIFGGMLPGSNGTDCSGLCLWAYGKVGVHLSRTTYGQYLEYPISHNAPYEPGDLIFIAGSDSLGVEPGHVMIYISPGQVFQAPFTGEDIGQYPYDTEIFEYRTRPALALPPPSVPTRNPTAEQIAHAGLVVVKLGNESNLAIANGWTVFYWGGFIFRPASEGPAPANATLYANKNYRTKHP